MCANSGRGLKQALVRSGQAIDPRGEKCVDARRNLKRGDGLGKAMRAWLANEPLRIYQHPHALFEKERIAVRSLDQQPFELVQRWIRAEKASEKLLDIRAGQWINTDHCAMTLAIPGVPVIRPIVHEQQQTRRFEAVDEFVEQSLCLAVDPVKVLYDQKQRSLACFLERRAHRRERRRRA